MKPEQWRKLVFGVLIVALGAWYGLTQWSPATSSAATGAPEDGSFTELADVAANAAAESPDAAPVDDRLAEVLAQLTEWPADPFCRVLPPQVTDAPAPVASTAPPAEGPQTSTAYALTGIIAGPRPMAMLNGRLVGVGDELPGGVTVIAIDDLSVTLREPTGTHIVSLPK